MPQVGEHGDAAVLDLGRLRILVLVDHVLVDALVEEAMHFGFDPGLAERGEVLPRVAVEEEFVADGLVNVPGVPLVLGEEFLGQRVGEVAGGEDFVGGIARGRGCGEGHDVIWC